LTAAPFLSQVPQSLSKCKRVADGLFLYPPEGNGFSLHRSQILGDLGAMQAQAAESSCFAGNSAAFFYGKICNNLFIELFQKMAVNQARKRLD
jgi:hypothetical protein